MKFAIVNVVWGKDYIKFFTEVSLPLCLSPNNLGYLAKNVNSIYCIYTDEPGATLIQKSPMFKRLQDTIPIGFRLLTHDKGHIMPISHNFALEEFGNGRTALVFICPDLLMADGTFKYLYETVKKGKKAVMACGARVSMESALRDLKCKHLHPGKEIITPRELVRLALYHMHPQMRKMFWSDKNSYFWPSHIYWNAGNTGYIVHPFHVHPLLVVPGAGVEPKGTIDGDLILRSGIQLQDIDLVTDSDQLCIMEASSSIVHPIDVHVNINSVEFVAGWAKEFADEWHRYYFKNTFRYHSEDLTNEWKDVERKANEAVDKILMVLGDKGLLPGGK